MTKAEMAEVMQRIFEDCHELRDKAHKEYAGGDDALGNFKRLGIELNLPPESVLWVYATKHKDGIIAHINGHRSQREPVYGRIRDYIVYLCLLEGILKEREGNANDTK